MFDWNDLRHFLATARAGSTLAASRALGVNQSTVARRLDALEAACGFKLFERDRNGAALTEAGADLVSRAEDAERAMAALEHRMTTHKRGMSGMIRLTCSELLATIGVIPAMGEFRRLYPDIQIELVLTDAFLDIENGQADVALRAGYGLEPSSLVARKLMDEYWGVYCSEAYIAAHGAPARKEDLPNHVLIAGEGPIANIPPLRWLADHAGPDAALAMRCNTVVNMINAVTAGLGVVALPTRLGDRQPDLRYCLPVLDGQKPAIWLVTRASLRDTPHVRAFIDFIVPHLMVMSRQTPDRSADFPPR